jgi:hypothetical protein
MKQITKGIAALLFCSALASANIIVTWNGDFAQDDSQQVFHYFVQNTGPVHVYTTSYAPGGFQTVLSLFDDTGNFVFGNDGYGTASDADLSWNSVAGTDYLVVLTEYDNFANGPTYADGFTEDGMGNFTANPPFNNPLPGGFYLPGGEQRTSNWSVTFDSADATGLVVLPEPATWGLGVAGAMLLAAYKKFGRTQ